jgi:hypothetical protein
MLNRLRAFPRHHPDLTLIVLALLAFGLVQLLLGTHATPIDTFDGLLARLSAGEPLVIEFYSNL